LRKCDKIRNFHRKKYTHPQNIRQGRPSLNFQGWEKPENFEKTREFRKNPTGFYREKWENGKNYLFSKNMFKKHFKPLANK
jgi:hypothetical protein